MIKSEENLERTRWQTCAVCDNPPPNDPHHWRTKGAGGGDDLENLLTLCRPHHAEVHTIGKKTFYKKYKALIMLHRKWYSLPELKR